MILIIDNYDSFTFNLYQLAGALSGGVRVIKNDELTAEQILALKPSHIILSPGPGKPSDAGVCKDIVKAAAGKIPLLGVCLGHQVICEVYGATVTYAKKLMHGKKSLVHIANGSPLFKGLAPVLECARYHSLSAKRDTLPDELLVIAEDDDGEVMGVKHKDCDLYGLQFHPESILTSGGKTMMENFLKLGGKDL